MAKKFGKGGPTSVEPKGFKPQVRMPLPVRKPSKARAELERSATDVDAAVARGNREPREKMPPKYTPSPFAKGGQTKKGTKMADKAGRALVKKSADTMGRAMKKYASGGLVGGHKSADGIAKKGKTKGTKIAMARGGKCM